jgi:outer membrane biosynthesis protein TonB
LITDAGDTIAPAVVNVTAGTEVKVKARLSVQPTVVKLRVCRDCDAAFYRVPELIRVDATRPRDERSAAIPAPAEPEEVWNAFYEQSRPYPPTLKDPTLEGEVILEGTISPEGSIVGLRVASSPDLRLSDVALEMVQPQRWRPALVRATPIESQLQTTVEFTVRGFR